MTKAKVPYSKNDWFRLKLPAHSENLDIIRKFIDGVLFNTGIKEDRIYQIELAVDEACANVIQHAYIDNSSREKHINITINRCPDRIVIMVADKGIGFDPDAIESPNMEEYLKRMRPGGLGLHLIRTLMDEVSFSIKPGVRNQVRMVKRFSKKQ